MRLTPEQEQALVIRFDEYCSTCTCWRCYGFCSEKECKRCESIREDFLDELRSKTVEVQ